MTAELKKEIVEHCKQINQNCQLQYNNFTFRNLCTREWYLNVMQTLFPHLQQNISAIKTISDEAQAINKLISEINDLDQFDRLQVDGQKIVQGDVNQIHNLVQIILALFQIAMEQHEEEQYQNNNQQEFKNINIDANMKKNNFNSGKEQKSHSDYDKPRSVQAIVNQFDKSQEQQGTQKDQEHQQADDNQEQYQMKTKKQNFNQPYKKFNDKNKLNFDQKSSDENRIQNVIKNAKKNNKKLKNKNPESHKIIEVVSNKKKLVTHPKSPVTLKKARSSDAIALTNKIEQDIKKTKKKLKPNNISSIRAASPMQQQMKRKTKQFDYKSKQHEKQKKRSHILKQKKKDFSQKNQKNLYKLLNWREQQIKKQRKQYQQSLKTKLLDKKQQYIKKINKLILQLQKQKKIQQQKQFKQNLIKDNEQAVKRLTFLQQWYKNKLSMLKQNRKAKQQQRVLIKTGHKEMIGRIQKYLKRENQEKLIRLTDKFRSQNNNIQTDFEELKDKIIKVYKKN